VTPANTTPPASALLKQAFNLHQQGKLQKALKAYQRALKTEPKNFLALDSLGTLHGQMGKFDAALNCFTLAAAIQPNDFAIHFNRGIAFKELNRLNEALNCFAKAIELNPNFAEAYNSQGAAFRQLGRPKEALACFDKAIELKPNFANAYHNRGVSLLEMQQQLEQALADFNQAIALNPGFAEAYYNRGMLLNKMRHNDQAIASYDQAIVIKPDYADAFHNRGSILRDRKRYEESLNSYNKAIEINSNHPYAHADRLLAQMYICDWTDFKPRVKKLMQSLDKNIPAIPPFHLLALSASAEQLKKAATLFAAAKYPAAQQALWNGEHYSHQRLRIGYFSADFHNHATAYLMAELFESHDRNQFEIFAFSFGPATQDEMQTRLAKSFDHFFDLSKQSDHEIATKARELEIDIAIDLKGYTQDSRPEIFALRPAPLQVNYLGFPGTMAAPYIDYIIGDPVVTPAAHFNMYSEKVVQLPHCYQVNDSQRQIAEQTPSRQQLGLPETGFVFCCFNNNFKITPDVFSLWMRLLSQVDDSVLWLFEGSKSVCHNLRLQAQKHGIDPERLVFAPRMELAEHLARHKQADLFLDTFYYNAHTTASDALWAGLPVLTCLGNTFASRVAASLLQAIGLPELITHSHDEYETLALDLARHPEKIAAIKQKLADNRLTQPLFNTGLFRQQLESAYRQIWQRHQEGLAPDHIFIAD